MKKNCIVYLIFASVLVLISCGGGATEQVNQTDSTKVVEKNTEPEIVVQSLDIEKAFIPCGFMGDIQNVKLVASCIENPHSATSCIKISYKVGSNGWAGIYWSTKDCNWGDEKGFDFSKKGFTKITFWAKGLNGNESVQFKAGGMKDRKFKDSFDIEPKLSVNLSKEWQQFTIDLKGMDLSSVIGGFCWVANSNVTLFLDDLRYE